MSDLVGVHEITVMLGKVRQRVHQLAADPSFPRPVAELHMGRIWRRRDIVRWAARAGYDIKESR